MKIAVASDLHLEFPQHHDRALNYVWPEADLLVLAGDVFNADRLRPERTDKDGRRHRMAADAFVDNIAKVYPKIVYVMGNHDHYNGFMHKTEAIEREFFGDRIQLLHNQTVAYKGLEIVGATLWTDMNAGDPDVMRNAEWGMNDYRVIMTPDGFPITAKHTIDEHRISKAYIKNAIHDGTHKRLIVTHHAPSRISLHKKHKGNMLDFAYASDLDDLAASNNIAAWIHGHTHQNEDYMIGDTRVFANQQGYYSEQFNGFDPSNGVFEIDV